MFKPVRLWIACEGTGTGDQMDVLPARTMRMLKYVHSGQPTVIPEVQRERLDMCLSDNRP